MRSALKALTIVVLPLMLGCQIGPKALQTGHPQYSQAVRKIADEEMLLNLVRIRYFEMPVFLQVSSISTQFALRKDLNGSYTWNEDNVNMVDTPDIFGLSLGLGYEERPTITFGLPESREFLGRMMAPLGADQLTVLARAGGGADMIMRMGVKKMNRLENLNVYTGTEVTEPATYKSFLEALHLIIELQTEGLIDFGYAWKLLESSSPFESIDSRAISDGQRVGVEYYVDEEGKYIAHTFKQLLHLRFSKASDDDPRAQRLRKLLGLSPDQYSFEIINGIDAGTEKARIMAGEVAAALDPDAVWKEVALENRSMLEILYHAAMGVNVPQNHLKSGIINPATDSLDGMLTVRCSKLPPRNTAVRVRYKGYWFYIAADDLKSRSTFRLLNALFASTAGTVPGAKPVLTLPVGG